MGRVNREITVMTPVQAEAFAKLAKKVTEDVGVIDGMQLLGITSTTYYRLINRKQITDKQAVALMRGYRKYKEQAAA